MFFTRCFTEEEYDDYCIIMESNYDNNSNWSEPEKLPFIKENINYGHPFWIEKDSVLFFASKQSVFILG